MSIKQSFSEKLINVVHHMHGYKKNKILKLNKVRLIICVMLYENLI